MTQRENVKKLGKNESYKCPFPHPHPRHEMAFFKDFDSHFRTFGDSDDHFAVVKLHEELFWKLRCSESEKRNLSENDLGELSVKAWLEAVKKSTGKEIQVVQRK
jgi:hypothetical protein